MLKVSVLCDVKRESDNSARLQEIFLALPADQELDRSRISADKDVLIGQ